jgi:Fe-S-cluster containining protein
MADMDAIRARGADPDTLTLAQYRSDAIVARIDRAAAKKLAAQATAANSKQAKVVLLRQLADGVVKASAGIAPCKKGCNHCCKMATLVTVQEAEVIARETGAKLSQPARFNQFTSEWRQKYEGVACSFLTEQGCSIYLHRPYACRVHVSVDADNLLCEIVPGVKIRAPSVNVSWYDTAFVTAFGGALTMKYADIREFFVPRTGTKA